MLQITKRGYAIALGILLILAALPGAYHVPFSSDFKWVALVYFSLSLALPCLTTRRTVPRQIVVGVVLFGCGLALLWWCLSGSASTVNASTAILLGAAAHFLLLKTLTSDPAVNSAVFLQDSSIAYAMLMWLFLRHTGIAADFSTSSRFLYDARFLFWPPFAAVVFWAYNSLVKRSITAQLMIVLAIMQPCIGFVDLGSVWHVHWAYAAVSFWALSAFGLAIWMLRSQPAPARGR